MTMAIVGYSLENFPFHGSYTLTLGCLGKGCLQHRCFGNVSLKYSE